MNDHADAILVTWRARHFSANVHVRARRTPIVDIGIALTSALTLSIDMPFVLARRTRSTSTSTTAHTPAHVHVGTHCPQRRHHSTASVRTN